MGRPREFDEEQVLEAVIQCFWRNGYGATSIQDLVAKTGLTAASLYNAFGDKRALFRAALDQYVERSVGARMRRCEALPPRTAIETFFEEILHRSLSDREHKGCLLVNSALEVAPHNAQLQEIIAKVLLRIESFFRKCIRAGQADGTITRTVPALELARHLLAVLMGVRVLARVRPERPLLEGIIVPALILLGTVAPGKRSAAR